ncbi:haloacid dehalogenase type II [Nakamurella sp. YIM 132087]|uniref:Haloacid dehalogenase type II n=1 Tax=Nakamurella alba TaxID=2665158 RepID=A0A7K1FS57_9ACTN|nr:haloacid dehalogenase type II [Nakamurella alba]
MDLTRFRALSFDCYGTLIDWESGILAVLRPWADAAGVVASDEELLQAFAAAESDVEAEQPTLLYPDVLAATMDRVCTAFGVAESAEWAGRLGASVPDWPAFPDSADALASLARRYRLIILSNVHRAGFAASNLRLRGEFTAVITAQDVGGYKPGPAHFTALAGTLDDLGVARDELLHVAQSLYHDHVPAHREGLASVWINRRHDAPGWGATREPGDGVGYDLEFPTMAAFAAAVEAAFGD